MLNLVAKISTMSEGSGLIINFFFFLRRVLRFPYFVTVPPPNPAPSKLRAEKPSCPPGQPHGVHGPPAVGHLPLQRRAADLLRALTPSTRCRTVLFLSQMIWEARGFPMQGHCLKGVKPHPGGGATCWFWSAPPPRDGSDLKQHKDQKWQSSQTHQMQPKARRSQDG